MEGTILAAMVNGGVAGVMLYLFATDRLRTKAACDEAETKSDARLAEMRKDRDEWKRLALGTERRLDRVVAPVAKAIQAAVPYAQDATEAGE